MHVIVDGKRFTLEAVAGVSAVFKVSRVASSEFIGYIQRSPRTVIPTRGTHAEVEKRQLALLRVLHQAEADGILAPVSTR